MQLALHAALKDSLTNNPLFRTRLPLWFCLASIKATNGREPAPLWFCFFPLNDSDRALCMMCLVPCMRKTCKGKVQSACCLMNVFPFLSPSLSCAFRRQQCGRWVLSTLFSNSPFAFYFSVLIEFISKTDGKLTFLNIHWFLVVYDFEY